MFCDLGEDRTLDPLIKSQYVTYLIGAFIFNIITILPIK